MVLIGLALRVGVSGSGLISEFVEDLFELTIGAFMVAPDPQTPITAKPFPIQSV